MQAISIIWFRRDLRLHDNAALYHALKSGAPVLPIFIFDQHILDKLEDKADRRVEFIHLALQQMQQQLVEMGSTMEVHYGTPEKVFTTLLSNYTVQAVYTNHDYEQYAIDRDARFASMLQEKGIGFHTFKDHVLQEKGEVLKDDGKPYTVFTPYSRKWRACLTEDKLQSFPTEQLFKHFLKQPAKTLPSLASMGFQEIGQAFPAATPDELIIKHYSEQRDYPAINGTSRLGVHLRFGTISIRDLAKKAM
ncbi:MAG TPA: deoxyribodipyrimidine photolyase, partial [Chitinophagaceae bacterium]|nr:deoxyribodipyrimidine photolyase [Chitinophagaceae bacterium]